MRAGFVQFQPAFGEPDKNISCIEELISGKNFDLIVIPELANSGYLFSSKDELQTLSEEIPDGIFSRFLRRISANKKCHVVSGICERAGEKFYNSAVLVHPDGQIDTYRKIHLFYEEKMWFTPGDRPPEVYDLRVSTESGRSNPMDDNIDLRGAKRRGSPMNDNIDLRGGERRSNPVNVKIGMMVCFDWRFPETARTLALKGAQIICHPSNLVMAHCQDAMVIRALENQVFTITANRIGKDIKRQNSPLPKGEERSGGGCIISSDCKELTFTGRSIMVNPKGDVIHIAPEDKEECYITDIDPVLALDKMVTKYNNIFEDRRVELYFK